MTDRQSQKVALMSDTSSAPLRVDIVANMRKQLGMPEAKADAGPLRTDIVASMKRRLPAAAAQARSTTAANMQRILDNRSTEGARP